MTIATTPMFETAPGRRYVNAHGSGEIIPSERIFEALRALDEQHPADKGFHTPFQIASWLTANGTHAQRNNLSIRLRRMHAAGRVRALYHPDFTSSVRGGFRYALLRPGTDAPTADDEHAYNESIASGQSAATTSSKLGQPVPRRKKLQAGQMYLQVTLPAEQMQLFKAAAAAAGVSRDQFLRQLIDERAGEWRDLIGPEAHSDVLAQFPPIESDVTP